MTDGNATLNRPWGGRGNEISDAKPRGFVRKPAGKRESSRSRAHQSGARVPWQSVRETAAPYHDARRRLSPPPRRSLARTRLRRGGGHELAARPRRLRRRPGAGGGGERRLHRPGGAEGGGRRPIGRGGDARTDRGVGRVARRRHVGALLSNEHVQRGDRRLGYELGDDDGEHIPSRPGLQPAARLGHEQG